MICEEHISAQNMPRTFVVACVCGDTHHIRSGNMYMYMEPTHGMSVCVCVCWVGDVRVPMMWIKRASSDIGWYEGYFGAQEKCCVLCLPLCIDDTQQKKRKGNMHTMCSCLCRVVCKERVCCVLSAHHPLSTPYQTNDDHSWHIYSPLHTHTQCASEFSGSSCVWYCLDWSQSWRSRSNVRFGAKNTHLTHTFTSHTSQPPSPLTHPHTHTHSH